MAADARVEADTADDLGGVEATRFRIGVELVEIRDTQREERVREQFDRLRLRRATDEFGDAHRAIGVHSLMLLGRRTLRKQVREGVRGGDGRVIIHRRAHDDARRVQVVIERMALAQELRGEDDLLVTGLLTQLRRVADRNRRLDDDPAIRVVFADRLDRGLDARRVEVVLLRIIIRRRRDDGVFGSSVRDRRIDGRLEIKVHRAVALAVEEARDLGVHDRARALVEHRDLLRHDVERVYLIVLRKQQCDGQSHIAGAGDCDLHQCSRFFLTWVDEVGL